jgi:HEAT repeat protein
LRIVSLGAPVRFFKPNIEKLATKRDITGLTEALGDSDRALSAEAGAALLKIGNPGIEALVAGLRNKSGLIRQGAAVALGEAPISRAASALAAALKEDTNPHVRAAAARAIGQQRTADSAAILVGALDDVPEVEANAREALLGLGKDAVEPLIAALGDVRSQIREAAAAMLGELADARSYGPLVAALQDSDPAVVGHATLAVERFRRVQSGLVEDLLNPTLDVRRYVVKVLDELGWQPPRNEFGAAYWAAKCRWEDCVRIGAPAVKPLIRAILGIAEPGETREDERRNAAMTLGELGLPAIGPVLKAAAIAHYPDDTHALLQTLAFVTDPGAVDELIAVLAEHPYGQLYAVQALAQIGDPRAVEALGAALSDTGRPDDVRTEAAHALGRIRDPRAVEPLLAVLAFGVQSADLESAVVSALAAIGDRRACASVIEAILRHPRSAYGWRPWAEGLRSLCGDYAETIADLAGFYVDLGDRKEVLGYRDEVLWIGSTLQFVVDANRTALAALCERATPLTTNLLHQIHSSLALTSSYPGAFSEFKRDFAPLKQIAADELERRGNPPFDPAVYLAAAAWKLETKPAV